MITINGDYQRAITVSNQVKEQFGLTHGVDFTWTMKPFSRNTQINFACKDETVETMIAIVAASA